MGLLEVLIIVILLLWLAGWNLGVGGSLIHLLIIIIAILVIVRLLQGRNVL